MSRNYKTYVLYFLDSVSTLDSVQKLQDICLVLSGQCVEVPHGVQKLQDIFLLSGSVGSRHSVKLQDIFLLSGSVGSMTR